MADRRDSELGNSAKLCLSCGMCCDGSLFARGRLEAADGREWPERGLNYFEQGGTAYFSQSCACLDGKSCSLFGKGRPTVCRSFRCIPLNDLEACHRTFPQASETLEKALILKCEVHEAARAAGVPFQNFLHLKDCLAQAFIMPDSTVDPRAAAAALTALAKFNAFAEEYILPSDVPTDA